MSLRSASETHGGDEVRIWGPPGCGKTTYLSRQITAAARKFGSDGILVTSFTKAAATELVERRLPLSRDRVGTLHAHCRRALGAPEIADAHRDDWNRTHSGMRLSPANLCVDEMPEESLITGLGDELYGEAQVLRASLTPVSMWPLRVRRFHEKWTAWKRANGFVDFTDLLEIARRDLRVAPQSPQVIFVDEAQDLNRLQLELLRQWGRHAEHLVMAADDDQTIYTFAGAAPDALLARPVPEFFRHVLKQSYRVPHAVHALAKAWIQKVQVREPKEYLPRDAPGEVRILKKGDYKYPEPIVGDAERYLAKSLTVMFLATCSYMLEPLRAVLRKRGLPFHNPYRRKRADWNPLLPPPLHDDSARPERRSPTAQERLMAFLRPHAGVGVAWTAQDVRDWAAWLKARGVLSEAAARMLERGLPAGRITPDHLVGLIEPEPLVKLIAAMASDPLQPALDWWMNHLKPPRRRMAEYPVRVVERCGLTALRNTPRIIIGTGHSVKGGESDVVYLFPDLSSAGMRSWEGRRSERDSVIRLGYVMMTRARESLVLCEPAGYAYMPIAATAARLFRRSNG